MTTTEHIKEGKDNLRKLAGFIPGTFELSSRVIVGVRRSQFINTTDRLKSWNVDFPSRSNVS
jgi:hypothetical protein